MIGDYTHLIKPEHVPACPVCQHHLRQDDSGSHIILHGCYALAHESCIESLANREVVVVGNSRVITPVNPNNEHGLGNLLFSSLMSLAKRNETHQDNFQINREVSTNKRKQLD